MLKSFAVALVLGAVAAGPAAAADPGDLARAHANAVGRGDLAFLAHEYRADCALWWVGGALDGLYQGKDEIATAWTKFAKANGTMTPEIGAVSSIANPKGTTVTIDVTYRGAKTVKVREVLLYRGDQLQDEIWQIDAPPVPAPSPT